MGCRFWFRCGGWGLEDVVKEKVKVFEFLNFCCIARQNWGGMG